MFGITFFSNKVAKALFRKGYVPQDIPPIGIFKPLCDALKTMDMMLKEPLIYGIGVFRRIRRLSKR